MTRIRVGTGSSMRTGYRALACVLGISLLGLIVPAAAPAGALTQVSGNISTNTTWTTAGSPYVVSGQVTVLAGVTLTIQPGVTVRFVVPNDPDGERSRIVVWGTLLATGSASQRITFTSDRDAAFGGSGGPAAGNWGGIRFVTTSGIPPTVASRIEYADFWYGARSTSCLEGFVETADSRTVLISNDTFQFAQGAGVSATSDATVDRDALQITNSVFSDAACGVNASRSLTLGSNDFGSSISQWALWLSSAESALVQNRFSQDVVIYEPTAGLNVVRKNDFLADVVISTNAGETPKDLRWNWWGHVVAVPPFCETPSTPPNPQYNLEPAIECPPVGAVGYRVVSYRTSVLPALGRSAFVPAFGASGGSFSTGEKRGGCNAAAAARKNMENVGYPIECSTGNFWHTFEGLSVPGRGVPLDFRFTYNADAAAENGPLGYGWTHSYNMRLDIGSSAVTVHQENGAQVPFVGSGSTWAAPSRFDATLTVAGSTWTFTRKGREQFTFDGSGRPTSIRDLTDPAGYLTTLSYPSAAQMVVTDVAGRTLTFALASGRVTSVTDTASPARQVTFSYSGQGELSGFVDAAGQSWAFEYESSGSHRLTTMRKPNEAGLASPPKLVNSYDAYGRIASQTDWLGRTTTFGYDSAPGAWFQETTVTDPSGNAAVKTFAAGVMVGATRGYGTASESSWVFGTDPVTLGAASVADPNGNVTGFSYDGRGNLLSRTDPLGRQWSWTYDSFNNVLSEKAPNPSSTGPAAVQTTYGYSSGRLTSVTRRRYIDASAYDANTTTFTRADTAHPDDVTSVTDPDSKITTFTYAPSTGDVLTATDPLGNVTRYAYDTIGRMTSTAKPNSGTSYPTTITYNARRQPLTVTEYLNSSTTATTTRTYDNDGNLKTVTDPNGHVTQYSYDAADQLISVTRPDTTTLVSAYWPNGLLKEQRDGAGVVAFSYGYDPQGRLVTKTNGAGQTTTLAYDAAGRLASRAEPGGSCPTGGSGTLCTRYSYDAAGELVAVDYSDPATADVTYTYRPDGRRATMTDGTGTTTSGYDSLGRLTQTVDGAGATVGYGYNKRDLPTTITYPGVGTVTRTYDDAGQIATVTDWAGRTFGYSHDGNGNVDTIAFPGGVASDTFGYDLTDRMTSLLYTQNGVWTGAEVYDRDLAGKVTGSNGLASRSYGYTTLDQVCFSAGYLSGGTCAAPPTGAQTYDYDLADNLVQTPNAATQRFDAANQLCWTATTASANTCATAPAGATDYAVDGLGRRTDADPAVGVPSSYQYDQAGRLTQATVPNAAGTSGQYQPLTTSRILDTRTPSGTCSPSPCARLAANTALTVTVGGKGGVPTTGVSAVVLNVTAFNPSADSALVVYPADATKPSTRDLSLLAGQTVSNSVIVKMGAGASEGKVKVVASSAAVDVAFDVEGYFTLPGGTAEGGTYYPLPDAAQRIADSRDATRMGTCSPSPCDNVAAGGTVTVTVGGQGGIPSTGVSAVVMSVTVTNTTATGYTIVYPAHASQPSARNVSFNGSDTVTELIVVKLPPDTNTNHGKIKLYFGSGGADFMIDVAGWYTTGADADGAIFIPQVEKRLLDTRAATRQGTCTQTTPVGCVRLAAGQSLTVQVAGKGGVPAVGVTAVSLNVSAMDPGAAGYVTVSFQGGSAKRTISFASGEEATDAVITEIANGQVIITASVATDVLAEVNGWFEPAAKTWTYTYNGDGYRTTKTAPDGTVTAYTWDTSGPIPLLLRETTGSTTTSYVYGPDGLALEHVTGTTPTYYHHDQLGSTRVLTNSAGTTTGTANYNPYGTLNTSTGTLSPLGYAGQYTDAETGLQYLRARYYDPVTGQFLTRDPIEDLTREPYGYVDGDPVNATDPLGLSVWDDVKEGASDLWDAGSKAIDLADENAGTIATVASLASLAVPGAGALAVGFGAWSAYTNAQDGDYVGAALDIVGVATGATALGFARRSASLTDASRRVLLDRAYLSPWLAADAARYGAISRNVSMLSFGIASLSEVRGAFLGTAYASGSNC